MDTSIGAALGFLDQPTLLDPGARLDGAVIEAAYAFDRPPLLKRLADDRVLRIIDHRRCGSRGSGTSRRRCRC